MQNNKLIDDLNRYFLQSRSEIEDWFAQKGQLATNIFYSSVDLRNDGIKITPVDTNLFPAGFNNLSSATFTSGIDAVRQWFAQKGLGVKKVLIIPENHTRNMPYYENVAVLCDILRHAGCEVRVGSLMLEKAGEGKSIVIGNRIINLEVLWRKGDVVGVDNFLPEIILLNHDLFAGVPQILQNLQQMIFPSFAAGWFNRTKSGHFRHYREVSGDFANHFGFDGWQIAALFDHCDEVDFMQQSGMDCIAEKTAQLLSAIQKKYSEYKIMHKPFVVVKADAGSYGMGVMTVDSAEQLYKLSRRQRTHMATTKGGMAVRRVIIQEGVYTAEFLGADNNAPIEPVIYTLGAQVVGGFYRMNARRKNNQNLNSPGMQFVPLNGDNKFYYAYNVITRLAQLAAARELESYENM